MQYPHQEDTVISSPDLQNFEIKGVGAYRSETNADLWLGGNRSNTEATPRQVVALTLDPAADALVAVAQAVPTATPTTPYWAQRANVTTPIDPTLPASFLTFKWNPADDVVTLYVNDGGTIRSVAIGTVA